LQFSLSGLVRIQVPWPGDPNTTPKNRLTKLLCLQIYLWKKASGRQNLIPVAEARIGLLSFLRIYASNGRSLNGTRLASILLFWLRATRKHSQRRSAKWGMALRRPRVQKIPQRLRQQSLRIHTIPRVSRRLKSCLQAGGHRFDPGHVHQSFQRHIPVF